MLPSGEAVDYWFHRSCACRRAHARLCRLSARVGTTCRCMSS